MGLSFSNVHTPPCFVSAEGKKFGKERAFKHVSIAAPRRHFCAVLCLHSPQPREPRPASSVSVEGQGSDKLIAKLCTENRPSLTDWVIIETYLFDSSCTFLHKTKKTAAWCVAAMEVYCGRAYAIGGISIRG